MNTLNTNTITKVISRRRGCARGLWAGLGAVLLALVFTPVLAIAHGGLEHVRGTIAKVSDQSVTVTTTAGKAVEVLLDAQTTYARANQPIQKTDLKVGDRVVIHAAEKGNTLTAHTVEVGTSSAAKKP